MFDLSLVLTSLTDITFHLLPLCIDMAPEIVRRVEYEGKPVDIWSLGILLYALLCGCFPFRAKAYPDLYRRIARGTFQIPEELSAPVKDLLNKLLTVDPEQRITAHAALRHPWLQVQFVNAPNMDKLRQDITFLISEKPADDLDEQVISELVAFGMSKDEIIRLVLTKTHSSLATLYYLLLDVIVGRRKANVKKASTSGNTSSNAMSLNQALNGSSGKHSSSANMAQRKPSAGAVNGNFANAILTSSNPMGGMNAKGIIAPVATGNPIVITQAVNDAAHMSQQQQQQQQAHYITDPQAASGADYRYGRPKSASATTRTSSSGNAAAAPVPMSMNTGNPGVNMVSSGGNNNNVMGAGVMNGVINGMNIGGMNPGVPQRPLSAYAGRR